MRHHHAFGRAGGSGGIDQVGGARWRKVEHGVRLRLTGEPGRIAIDEEHPRGGRVQRAQQPGMGQEDGRPRVFEHEGQPRAGVGGIERHVGAPGFQHTEDGDDHVQRSLQADGDQDLGSDPRLAQAVSDLVGPTIQLRVGQRRAGLLTLDPERPAGVPGNGLVEVSSEVPGLLRALQRRPSRRLALDDLPRCPGLRSMPLERNGDKKRYPRPLSHRLCSSVSRLDSLRPWWGCRWLQRTLDTWSDSTSWQPGWVRGPRRK